MADLHPDPGSKGPGCDSCNSCESYYVGGEISIGHSGLVEWDYYSCAASLVEKARAQATSRRMVLRYVMSPQSLLIDCRR